MKDEFVGWTFQAGTLVLAHRNIAIIDEFDKMSKEDRDTIHEALEQQTVTIAKAGVQARLSCECSLLAGANPKYGRFDPYANSIAEQLDLPPTIINRFDLIYPVKDTPEKEKDEKTAMKILDVHSKANMDCGKFDTALLRKYLFLAKKLMPALSKSARTYLIDYYLKIRNTAQIETGRTTIPISPRQLEGLIRLSEAYAKLRLSNTVDEQDAKKATELMGYCLREVAFDQETGTIDIDKIATGITTSMRGKISTVKELIGKLEETIGKNIPIEALTEAASTKNINAPDVEEAIKRLKSKGELYEPRKGYIAKL